MPPYDPRTPDYASDRYAFNIAYDEKTLRRAVTDYNAAVDNRHDRKFGRNFLIRKIVKPPFYALGPAKAYIIFTNGGLKVTHNLEVVHEKGHVIPGLYAAGANGQSGMLLEGHGHHLGWAFVSGRIAGKNAARNPV